jgi:hypothetical protein
VGLHGTHHVDEMAMFPRKHTTQSTTKLYSGNTFGMVSN